MVGWFYSDARGGRLLAENYPSFAVALGVAMTVAILVAATGTRSEIRHVNAAPPRQRGFVAQLVRDVRESARNKPSWASSTPAAARRLPPSPRKLKR